MTEENKLVVNENLKAQIDEDLSFLKDLKVHTVNGKKFLGDGALPINVSKIFNESEFVNEWLYQFALGNCNGINYFNFAKWSKFTNLGTLCAMVVNDKDEPVLIIPPMTTTNLTSRDLDLLRAASYMINGQQYNSAAAGATQGVVNKVEEHLETKRLTITELIPNFYYERFEMYPEMEQTLFYIKDVLLQNQMSKEDFDKTRAILVKEQKELEITEEERNFIMEITSGKYHFKEYVPKASDEKPNNNPEEVFDPLEC